MYLEKVMKDAKKVCIKNYLVQVFYKKCKACRIEMDVVKYSVVKKGLM